MNIGSIIFYRTELVYDSKIIEKLNRSIAAKSYQSIYSNCKKTIENTLSIK